MLRMNLPLKTKSVEETFHEIHAHENREGDIEEKEPTDDDLQSRSFLNTTTDSLLEEHLCELSVSKTQRP